MLVLASPWLVVAAIRQGKYREGFAEKFLGLVPAPRFAAPCVWLHAVSVGEVNLISPLVDELRRRHPDWQIVISTTTATGYALARTRYAQHLVFYCPLDFSWAVQSAVAAAAADLAGPGRAGAVAQPDRRRPLARRQGRGDQRPLERSQLPRLSAACARSPRGCCASSTWSPRRTRSTPSGSPLSARPADRVHVTGSLKFDGAQTDRANPQTVQLASLAGFAADDVVFLAGSTQEPEERLALEAFKQLSAGPSAVAAGPRAAASRSFRGGRQAACRPAV